MPGVLSPLTGHEVLASCISETLSAPRSAAPLSKRRVVVAIFTAPRGVLVLPRRYPDDSDAFRLTATNGMQVLDLLAFMLVARGRIELPTLRFSVVCSTN